MNKGRWKPMEFRALYSKMWQCSTTLSCSGVLNWRGCCSVLRNDRALFGLLMFPQKQSAGLRKDFSDFARNSMSPELGVPCIVIRGKELMNKDLANPPHLPTHSVPFFVAVVTVFCLMVHTSWDPLWKHSELSMAVSPHFLMKPPISYKTYCSVRKEAHGFKCSVCKCENLNSDTKHPHKMLKMSVCACDPSTGSRLLRKNCLGFWAKRQSSSWSLSISVTREWQEEKDRGKHPALPLLVFTQASEASTRVHARAYTHIKQMFILLLIFSYKGLFGEFRG